jgi:hypothetical protein
MSGNYNFKFRYIKIQIEDLKAYDNAIEYLSSLEPELVSLNLKRYGYQLVSHRPQEMTTLMLDIIPKLKEHNIDNFLRCFVGQPLWCAIFIERILSTKYQLHFTILYTHTSEPVSETKLDEFETLRSLCNVLLQLCVCLIKTEKAESQKWISKTLQILKHPYSQYDADQALVICKQNHFSQGILYLYERMGLYTEMINYYIDGKDDVNILRICEQFRFDIKVNL